VCGIPHIPSCDPLINSSALDSESNTKVAIKKIPKVFQDLVDGKRILREIKLLRHFQHENIIQIKDICRIYDREHFQDIYIVNELMATDLHQVIRSKQNLTREHFQYFAYQILRGLKYIHSARVLHRDLKPSNILVNANCDVKICDFGLARGMQMQDSDMTEYVVTRWYRAPELLLMCQEYSEAIDIWSIGCILAEMIQRKPFFPGKNYLDQLNLITNVVGTPTSEDYQHVTHEEACQYLANLEYNAPKDIGRLLPNASPLEVDLITKMLIFNPEKRISTEEALKHPYFKGLHDPSDEPVASSTFTFEYDSKEISAQALRAMLHEEMLRFHSDLRQ